MTPSPYVVPGLAAVTFMVGFVAQSGLVTRLLGDVATMQVSRTARLDAPTLRHEQESWVAFRLQRVHSTVMGSLTPDRATLYAACTLPAPGNRRTRRRSATHATT